MQFRKSGKLERVDRLSTPLSHVLHRLAENPCESPDRFVKSTYPYAWIQGIADLSHPQGQPVRVFRANITVQRKKAPGGDSRRTVFPSPILFPFQYEEARWREVSSPIFLREILQFVGREKRAVAMNVAQLEEQLLQITARNAPGREFCDAIAELARTGRFGQLRSVLPAIVYDELWSRYRRDPAAFVVEWRALACEMRQGFVQHARQRLTSLTRLQHPATGTATPAWQEIQRALDNQENDLLRAAFALELLEMIEPAVAPCHAPARVRRRRPLFRRGRPLPG